MLFRSEVAGALLPLFEQLLDDLARDALDVGVDAAQRARREALADDLAVLAVQRRVELVGFLVERFVEVVEVGLDVDADLVAGFRAAGASASFAISPMPATAPSRPEVSSGMNISFWLGAVPIAARASTYFWAMK